MNSINIDVCVCVYACAYVYGCANIETSYIKHTIQMNKIIKQRILPGQYLKPQPRIVSNTPQHLGSCNYIYLNARTIRTTICELTFVWRSVHTHIFRGTNCLVVSGWIGYYIVTSIAFCVDLSFAFRFQINSISRCIRCFLDNVCIEMVVDAMYIGCLNSNLRSEAIQSVHKYCAVSECVCVHVHWVSSDLEKIECFCIHAVAPF